MIGLEQARAITDRLLAGARGRGLDLQVTVLAEDGNLTRFAGSEIHQNISQRDVLVILRAHRGGALAETSVHGTDPDAHDRALDRVVALVAHARPVARLSEGLPEGGPALEHSFIAPGAQRLTLAHKARAVASLHRIAGEAGALAYGAFVTGRTTLWIASTRGVRAALESSDATLETLCAAGERSGYASVSGLDPLALDVEAAAHEAASMAARRGDAQALPPGEYDVILGPHAVVELLTLLSYYGANGHVHNDNLSFLQGQEGRQVFAKLVTIRDDGTDPTRGLPMPFDLEGLPRAPATVVDHGVFGGAMHDRVSVLRATAPPCATGRSTAGTLSFLGSPPLAQHLQLEPGAAPTVDLVRGVRRGVWVTRLWYVRMQDRMRGVATGLTRDGTAWIEGGEITRPLRGARFTQAVTEILSRVVAVGREGLLHAPTAWLEPRLRTASWVPALRIEGMRFTS